METLQIVFLSAFSPILKEVSVSLRFFFVAQDELCGVSATLVAINTLLCKLLL
jgi:hypothetical protein